MKRLQQYQLFQNLVSHVAILDEVQFTDETWLYINGYVNCENR